VPQVDLVWVQFDSKADFVTKIYTAALKAGLLESAAELLTAQAAHETGWGKGRRGLYPDKCHGVMNNNVAGIKSGRRWRLDDKPICVTGTSECVKCKPGEEPSPECPPGQRLQFYPKVQWRAYPTLEDGVRGVVEFLDQTRYKKPRKLLLHGDTAFFRALGKAGYYTASPDVYHASSIRRLRTVRSMLETLRWQDALLRFDPGCLPKDGADGFWGAEGIAALKQFQAAQQLPAHGNRDKRTADALFKADPQLLPNSAWHKEAETESAALLSEKPSEPVATPGALSSEAPTAEIKPPRKRDAGKTAKRKKTARKKPKQAVDPEDPPT
jgi:hypothetical protein